MATAPQPLPAEPHERRRAADRPLSELAPGATGVVTAVLGDDAVANRLRDLGFLPGTPVCVRRRAPLGDPTEYELRGTHLCLRASEGARIRVSPR